MFRNSNVLRNKDVTLKGKVSLSTYSEDNILDISEKLNCRHESIEEKISKAKEEYEKTIKMTKDESKLIIDEAKEKAESMEKQAYELGYEQGLKNGYEDGYRDSYENNIEKAKLESEKIREEAYQTLNNINSEISDYIKINQEKILQLSISIAEKVLIEKFEDTSAMNQLLENVIREYDLKKNLIIKVNPIYRDELVKNTQVLKEKLNLSQEVLIVSDLTMDIGNAEIENDGGKIRVGIDSVLEKVKSELL